MIPAEERIVFLLTFFVIETREVEKIVTVTPCFTACYSLYFYIHLLFDLDAFALHPTRNIFIIPLLTKIHIMRVV